MVARGAAPLNQYYSQDWDSLSITPIIPKPYPPFANTLDSDPYSSCRSGRFLSSVPVAPRPVRVAWVPASGPHPAAGVASSLGLPPVLLVQVPSPAPPPVRGACGGSPPLGAASAACRVSVRAAPASRSGRRVVCSVVSFCPCCRRNYPAPICFFSPSPPIFSSLICRAIQPSCCR